MGYETKLIIGMSSFTSDEFELDDLIIEDGEAYRPHKRDDSGEIIKTGRKETYFSVIATLDLCKCGYESNISKLDFKNTDENHQWYWYDGEEKTTTDPYGDKPKPLPVSVVLAALKKDEKEDSYRRFKWAIALLESMRDDKESDRITVLFYGH